MVTLAETARAPNGRRLTRRSLPDPSTRRWTAQRKLTIVLLVNNGVVTRPEVLSRYPDLSDDELSAWQSKFAIGGVKALAARS